MQTILGVPSEARWMLGSFGGDAHQSHAVQLKSSVALWLLVWVDNSGEQLFPGLPERLDRQGQSIDMFIQELFQLCAGPEGG